MSMSYLERAKKIQSDLKAVEAPKPASVTDVTEGRILAVEICSTALEAHIWLALDDSFDPKDGQAVFYAYELPSLAGKSVQQLRQIHRVKLSFGPGSRVRQTI